jgi:hypothetical protein
MSSQSPASGPGDLVGTRWRGGSAAALMLYNENGARVGRTAPLSDHQREWSTFIADDGLSRLTDDEKTALAALLKRTIDADRYPLSPRIGTLRGILAKLEPPKPAPAPLPPLRRYEPPRAKAAQRRARR